MPVSPPNGLLRDGHRRHHDYADFPAANVAFA